MARPSVTATGSPPAAGMVQTIRWLVPSRRPQKAIRLPPGDQLGCTASCCEIRSRAPSAIRMRQTSLLVPRRRGSLTSSVA
jgi:hypothetical protein